MSGSDVEHVSCFLNGNPRELRRQSSPNTNEYFYDTPTDDSFETSLITSSSAAPSFASTTYSAQQGLTDSPILSATAGLSSNDRSSPDPDDYYRPHPPALVANGDTAACSGESLMVEVDNAKAAENHPTQFQRVCSVPAHSSKSSVESSGPFRSLSDSSYGNIGLGSTTGVLPARASTARPRQVSFKDLVSKFNNNPDQVLPLPSTSTSRTVSLGSPTDGSIQFKTASRERQTHDSSIKKTPIPRWNTIGTFDPDIPSEQSLPRLRTSDIQDNRPSSSNLSPQRPPFGEWLALDTSFDNLGYGTPSLLRRRGSEGTIPSPNPAFLDHPESALGLTPLTPTAWYLGRTPFLETVNTTSTTSNHRRTRSDFAGDRPGGAAVCLSDTHMAVQPPLQPQPVTSLESPHSKSRIPISSRRLNSPSVSGDSSPSSPTRTDLAFGSRSAQSIALPPKGVSRLPKPSPKQASNPARELTYEGEATFATPPHARREVAPGRARQYIPEKGALLEAYIAAPPPKKSPPLRSSRPRQPVSQTAQTAPRSKVVETVSNFQRQINRDRESRNSRLRERRLPELGNVDFATRRQKIQQAFTRTVEENERKEEKAAELRRQVNAQEDTQQFVQPTTPKQQCTGLADVITSVQPEDNVTVIEEFGECGHETEDMTPETEASKAHSQLHIHTDVSLSESSRNTGDYHPMTMDSPTLGHPEIILNSQGFESTPGDLRPDSAATTVSNETHITAFDPEPQDEFSKQNLHASHRTLLSQIMRIRDDSSPSGSSCDDQDYGFSDNEEKESIPIVLRDALTIEDSIDSSENQEHRDIYIKRGGADGEPANRWSMSSWSSSLHHGNSSGGQCEGSDDGLSNIQHFAEDSEEASTQSCSASSSTPSVIGHQLPHALSQTASEVTEPSKEVISHTIPYGSSSTPSLIRLGGWDSKRVSQLYIEELASGRSHKLPMPAIRASPEPPHSRIEQRDEGINDNLTDDPVLITETDRVPPSERMRHPASLFLRDDWEHASPSIMDWMQIAVDEGSAPQDLEIDGSRGVNRVPIPRLVTPDAHPRGADEGLGLAINVQLPQEFDNDDVPPPPIPRHDPPAPPSDTLESAAHPPLPVVHPNIFSNAIFAPLGPVQSTDSSEDSSLRRLEPTPSSQTLDSSATSLVPSTSEHPRPQTASPSPEERQLKKRRHVIKELVDTEHTFGKDMRVVDHIYKATSSSCLDLSAEDVKVLFANSDQVVKFSMEFQDTLKEAARSVYIMPKSQRWTSQRNARNPIAKTDQESSTGTSTSNLEKDNATFIGQAFIAHIENMEKVYAEYLKNHDAANRKLQTLQKNPKVDIWLKECRSRSSDLTTAWDLDSLLVKPVQRILKYPLLLSELLESTPKDHPDRAALISALEEVTNISVRINELKKRADVVGQVVGRKRKESDVRAGLSKAFGRRTEKLKQQVGLSDMFEDKEYDILSQKFGTNFIQLQVVMRDLEWYTSKAQGFIDCLGEITSALEEFKVGPAAYHETEGKCDDKCDELKAAVQDVMVEALPRHIAVVRKSVIDPIVTLLKLHDGPQRVMHKRDKRLMDYARLKSIKERGDKPDKKTTEQGEQFVVLNEALKDELPKLYSLTTKLMEACLEKFVHIQMSWLATLQEKLGPLVDSFPDDIQKVIGDWNASFSFSEAQVLSLGICNGSLLADTINLINFNTPPTGATISSPRRPSTVNSASTRVGSTMDESPKASHDFGSGGQPFQSPSFDSQSQVSLERKRADSTFSGRAAPDSIELPRSQMLQQITSSSSASIPQPNSNRESCPSLPRLSLDSPFLVDVIGPSESGNKPTEEQPSSPGGRYSGFFSSAMPMSDNPQDSAPQENEAPKEPAVLFLAASIYEFNIDRARREAGYPYLTYVVGEIFDVIAEKGELWLAKNQDDPTHQVGWIWNKHFAKLST